MTVSLRPHHLLCILTYLGKGYTPDFVQNYSGIIRRLNAGERIRLVTGPDDICKPMLSEDACHCHDDSVSDSDALAIERVSGVLGFDPASGRTFSLTPDEIASLRTAFSDGTLRAACVGCEWQDMCTGIAQGGFKGCRLAAPDQQPTRQVSGGG